MTGSVAPPGGRPPEQGRATIRDLADAAGVSRSTVSRALSGNGYVAPPVRLRIQQAAEDFGYVPDALARHLRQRVSRSIGVLVSDLRNPFYAELAAGASQAAREQDYITMLADDRGAAEDDTGAARAFVGQRTAGVVVTPTSAHVTDYLARHRVPVVEVDRRSAGAACDAVVVDDDAAARRVVEHLVRRRRRRDALLFDELGWTTGQARHAGYAAALRAAGLPVEDDLVVASGWDLEGASAAARSMLQRPTRPTAVFSANNVLAEGVWRSARQLGLRVPQDLSLVTFDDVPWMSMVSPGVTAVAQDAAALGRTAVLRLLDRIADPTGPASTVVLPTELVERGSTGPPP